MGNANETFDPFDPTGMLKEMRNSNMDAWAKMMTKLVNTDAYSESTGKMLDAWLTSSNPFRKAMEKSVSQSLESLNLPSLDDISRLNGRLTNIEMRLDDMDAKLDAFLSKIDGEEV